MATSKSPVIVDHQMSTFEIVHSYSELSTAVIQEAWLDSLIVMVQTYSCSDGFPAATLIFEVNDDNRNTNRS